MNENEKRTVERMIKIYCQNKHQSNDGLCNHCSKLNEYAHERLSRCTYGENKPTCEKCPIHCYKITMKKQIQTIMKYSGPRMIFYHPIAAIKHLFRGFSSKQTTLVLGLGLFVLVSCSGIDSKAWNDNLVVVYNKANNDLDDFQELISLGTVGDSVVNIHIKTKASEITKEVNVSLNQILEKEIPTGGDKFHTSMLEMLESVKLQVNLALTFTEYTEETSDLIIEKFAEEYDLASKRTNNKVDSLIIAQKEFAEAEKFEE